MQNLCGSIGISESYGGVHQREKESERALIKLDQIPFVDRRRKEPCGALVVSMYVCITYFAILHSDRVATLNPVVHARMHPWLQCTHRRSRSLARVSPTMLLSLFLEASNCTDTHTCKTRGGEHKEGLVAYTYEELMPVCYSIASNPDALEWSKTHMIPKISIIFLGKPTKISTIRKKTFREFLHGLSRARLTFRNYYVLRKVRHVAAR